MKRSLENLQKIKSYNTGKIIESIKSLSEQGFQSLTEVSKIKFPKNYYQVDKVVVAGMGGSSIGTDLIRKTLADKIRVFIEINNNYNLPNFADKKTLIISSSYSGNTEEVISATKEALKKKLPLIIITTGGKLARLAKNKKIPAYIFEPFYNPSNQPRMGLGYSIAGQIEILRKLKLIDISKKEIVAALTFLNKSVKEFSKERPLAKNRAKKTAQNIFGKTPVFFTSNYFSGNAHILSNQINENSKNFSSYYSFPELNHHLLEGLTHPEKMKNFIFISLESELDKPSIKKRQKVTKKILQKKKLKYLTLKLSGSDILSQSFWLLGFGSYLSFYLAVLNNEKPHLIPWVDLLKKELAK